MYDYLNYYITVFIELAQDIPVSTSTVTFVHPDIKQRDRIIPWRVVNII